MRKMLVLLVAVGALASVALCASYGWDQATEMKDRVTQAFIFGFVALVTLALHALAVRMWVEGKRAGGAFVGLVATLAFVRTAFTSLGGMATRSDKIIAERQSALDNKADIKKQIDQLEAERATLKFTRTSKATVDAAKRLADAATSARSAECGNGDPRLRGRFCRDKETAEAAAIAALAKAEAEKASTDRSDAIDAQLKALRVGPAHTDVATADPMTTLLGKIIGAWASVVTAWQKAVFAVIYDLCLVALMIGVEALGRPHSSKATSTSSRLHESAAPALDLTPLSATAMITAMPVPSMETEPPIPESKVIPHRPRPKLAATTKQPLGAPLDYLHEGLEVLDGVRTEMTDLFLGYATWCKSGGTRTMSPGQFAIEMEALCKKIGIRIEEDGAMAYVHSVKVRADQTTTLAK